jgi:hypothetical protein
MCCHNKAREEFLRASDAGVRAPRRVRRHWRRACRLQCIDSVLLCSDLHSIDVVHTKQKQYFLFHMNKSNERLWSIRNKKAKFTVMIQATR